MALCECGQSATRLLVTQKDQGQANIRYTCKGCARKLTKTDRPSASRGLERGVRIQSIRITGMEGTGEVSYRSR